MTKALLCLPSVSYSVVKDRFVATHPVLRGRATRTAGRSRGSAQATHKIYEAAARRGRPSLESGGDSGARTRSLRLAKPALSQLSYIPRAKPAAGTPFPGPPVSQDVGGPGWTRTTHLTLIRRAL